jgi:hypothetical protein
MDAEVTGSCGRRPDQPTRSRCGHCRHQTGILPLAALRRLPAASVVDDAVSLDSGHGTAQVPVATAITGQYHVSGGERSIDVLLQKPTEGVTGSVAHRVRGALISEALKQTRVVLLLCRSLLVWLYVYMNT